MTVTILDMNDETNTLNGSVLQSAEDAVRIFNDVSDRGRFAFKLESDNGSTLDIGISHQVGFAQHTPSDDTLPYRVACLADSPPLGEGDTEFVVGGTATPIDNRYCLPNSVIIQVVKEFVESGELSSEVIWEEI